MLLTKFFRPQMFTTLATNVHKKDRFFRNSLVDCILSITFATSKNMTMKQALFFILFFPFLMGCHRDSIKQRLDVYEKDLKESPQEVFLLLQKMKMEGFSLSKEDQRRMEFLTVKAKDRACIPLDVQDSVVLSDLIEYYAKNGTPNQLMGVYYLQGGVYRDLGDAPMAVETYLKAINAADTVAVDCDFAALARVYGQLADMQRLQALLNESQISAYKAAYYAHKAKDILFFLDIHSGIVASEVFDDHFTEHVDRIPSLIEQCMECGDTLLAVKQTVAFAWYYLLLDRPEEAHQMLRLYEVYSGNVSRLTYECSFPIYYGVKGMTLLHLGKLDSAEVFFRRELQAEDWNNRQTACRGLKELYEQTGRLDSALRYATLQCEAVDSDYQQKNAAEVQRLQKAYNYTHYREQLYESQLKVNRQRTWLIVCAAAGVIFILAVFLIYYIYRDQRSKQKHRLLAMERELADGHAALASARETLAGQEREMAETRQALAQTRLRHDTDAAQIEQAQQHIEELTRAIAKKTEEMGRQQQALDALNLQLENYSMIKERLLDKDEAQQLIDATLDAHRLLRREEWEQLEAFVRQEYPTFFPQLLSQVPKLNDTERYVALLIKLQVSVGNVSTLIGLTASAVFNARQRLYRKAFGALPPAIEDADEWIAAL